MGIFLCRLIQKSIFFSSEQIKQEDKFRNIKSKYILQKIFDNLETKRKLNLIKLNKNIKERLDININDYKEYFETVIEVKPIKRNYGSNFINIENEDDKKYIHIYLDNDKEETQKYYINANEEIKIIKIIIDYPFKSFMRLFEYCDMNSSINFKKCHRNDINNMSYMFHFCTSLKELNFNNFNTSNVTDMSGMFSDCYSLEELNLKNFNTNNVTDMSYMFSNCLSLKELNLDNFNTNNVNRMQGMFSDCKSLKELNLDNFNTNKVYTMEYMFFECKSLQKLNFNSLNTVHANVSNMFFDCHLIMEIIKMKYKNIGKEAFNY